MIVYMKRTSKNNEYADYAYGYDKASLDGILRVYIQDGKGEIIKETQDERVGQMGTLKAIGKLMRLARNNELSEIEVYQC